MSLHSSVCFLAVQIFTKTHNNTNLIAFEVQCRHLASSINLRIYSDGGEPVT